MLLISRSPMDQCYINSIMNKNIVYNLVLIFIIIQCVKSQDNDPDQPFEDDENEGEDEDDFDVLDLEQIIQQRLDRFEDPQYQHYDYYQPELQEYPTQPQTQPQPETLPQYYPGYQPQTQPQPEYQYYQPEQYDFYQPETQGYHPETQEYQTQPEQYDFYQPEKLQYQPEAYGYYEPPTTQPSYQQQQYYGPPLTQASQQPSYPYYLPPPTQPSYQQQPQYQYYQPTTTQTPTQTEVIQSQPQTQSETVEDDDDFYVTEHDQPIQEPEAGHETTQKSIQPQKEPRKRTRTKAQKSQVEEDECEGKKRKRRGGRQPKSYKKSIHIKFYKKNAQGNMEEMDEGDYIITHSDSAKSKYVFNTYLEQLQFDNEVIYIHIDGTPYCVSLIHGKKTNVFVMTNSYGFTLVKKVDGVWTRTDANIPDYVKFYTQDEGGNEILMTNKDYNIDFTSLGSFRYDLNPDIKCYKIVVKDMIAWEKTEDDDGFPELIYVTPKFGVILKFNKYTKTFERRTRKYQFLFTKKNTKKGKYY